MFEVKSLIKVIKENGCNFFTGVPDSVLKEMSLLLNNFPKKNISLLQMKVLLFQLV